MVKQPAKGRKAPAKSRAKTPKSEDVTPKVEAAKVEPTAPKAEVKPDPKPAVAQKVAPPAKVEDPVVKPQPETPKSPALEPQKTSAMPAIYGGLVAGAIGFGAAYIVLPKVDTTLPSRVSALSTEVSGLSNRIDELPVVDLSGVEATQSQASEMVAALDGRITELEVRFDALSSRAGSEGSLSAAAYAEELDALRAEMENLRGTAVAELGAARDAAASIEQNAEAAARAAAARAALSRIEGGLETGAPLGAALDDLADALQSDVPAELAMVRDGVATLASLQATFPDYARAALATARREGASGEAEGGFTAFLRNQLDVRSVAPKDGDSADAVLSRAEAALKEGRLTDTLAEVGALPEVARAELTEWQGLAETRADALAAAATLATSLNDN